MFFSYDKIAAQYRTDNADWVDPDEEDDSNVQSMLSDLSQPMIDRLASYGITMNGHGVSVASFDAFARAQDLFQSVTDAYDNIDEEAGKEWWAELELGGDDDVDYNGGIPSSVFDSIEKLWGQS